MKSLSGKKCFITGAASGIGRATALAAAAEGAELSLGPNALGAYGRDAYGPCAATCRSADRMDGFELRHRARFAEEIHARFGSMDVVANVAGISVWGLVENLSHQHWRQKCVDVNLMGPIHVIESFVPKMVEAKRGGHLVNVSSAAGLFGLPWHAAYSASKFGLRGISEVLRFDLEQHGIGVSLVCPGGVDTPLVDSAAIEIVGFDKMNPAFQKLRIDFAATPSNHPKPSQRHHSARRRAKRIPRFHVA